MQEVQNWGGVGLWRARLSSRGRRPRENPETWNALLGCVWLPLSVLTAAFFLLALIQFLTTFRPTEWFSSSVFLLRILTCNLGTCCRSSNARAVADGERFF